MCADDRTKWLYPQSKHSTLKMRSPLTVPAMSIPSQKLSLSLHLTKKEKGKEKENCKCCDMNFYFILKFVRIQYVQHSCDDSSVPSPQWLTPSHIKSVDIQNSDDKHLRSLHAWSWYGKTKQTNKIRKVFSQLAT